MIYDVDWLIKHARQNMAEISPGRWVPARPVSGTFRFEKLRGAWEVLRGRCDVLRWPGQEHQ